MSTAQITAGLRRTTDPTWRVFRFLASYWVSFQEWRKRGRLHDELSGLSNRGLLDIGIARGEIDYIASNRGADPRGIRSAE